MNLLSLILENLILLSILDVIHSKIPPLDITKGEFFFHDDNFGRFMHNPPFHPFNISNVFLKDINWKDIFNNWKVIFKNQPWNRRKSINKEAQIVPSKYPQRNSIPKLLLYISTQYYFYYYKISAYFRDNGSSIVLAGKASIIASLG
jgi:hypothetical protein